ncbi:MAG: signal peptide peptidase SppA, partial [Balneolaceae bacterium]|nr:signal peptide peptidase SppA [Balneolaceae bacterium]
MITFGTDGSNPFDTQPYITASFFEEQLEDILEDEDIKALVVRINSPGGSGSTSDLIWRRLREASKKIPVIASMGPVAASGGYYIAMAADTIVAETMTVTGSIGVFATKFNTRQLWNEELGITFDEVKTHRFADWLNSTRGLTETEWKAYQQYVDRFYQTFIQRVADSRQMTPEQVDEVGRGRVWTGIDAREQNLVDIIGGIETALETAAQKAGIEEYKLDIYPRQKDFFQRLMGSAGTKLRSLFGVPFLEDRQSSSTLQALFRDGRGDPMLLFPYELSIQ